MCKRLSCYQNFTKILNKTINLSTASQIENVTDFHHYVMSQNTSDLLTADMQPLIPGGILQHTCVRETSIVFGQFLAIL